MTVYTHYHIQFGLLEGGDSSECCVPVCALGFTLIVMYSDDVHNTSECFL